MAQGILLGRVTTCCPAVGAGGEFLNRRSEVRVLSGPPGFPTPPAAGRGAADPRDLICVCEDWPCRIPRNRMTSGRVCTA
jgi:hypothetical protein